MRNFLCLLIAICLFLFLNGCNTQKKIPVYSTYNEEKNVFVNVGMTKEEIDAILGESTHLGENSPSYMYFENDLKNQVVIQYSAYFTASVIQIHGTNWVVHDLTCRVNGKISKLSPKFKSKGDKPGVYYTSYYDAHGTHFDSPYENSVEYRISARGENDVIHIIYVGYVSIKS